MEYDKSQRRTSKAGPSETERSVMAKILIAEDDEKIGDNARNPKIIETVWGAEYRLNG